MRSMTWGLLAAILACCTVHGAWALDVAATMSEAEALLGKRIRPVSQTPGVDLPN